MNRTDLISVLHSSPFRAFRMVMLDGKTFPVPHEDFMWVSRSGTIMYGDDGINPWKMLNAALVVRIEYTEEQPASA